MKSTVVDYPKEDGSTVRCIIKGDKEFAWVTWITFDKDGKIIPYEE